MSKMNISILKSNHEVITMSNVKRIEDRIDWIYIRTREEESLYLSKEEIKKISLSV